METCSSTLRRTMSLFSFNAEDIRCKTFDVRTPDKHAHMIIIIQIGSL